MAHFRTEPEVTTGMPSGVPFIIANEAAERFSYYGMRSILVIYMTQWLVNSAGVLDTMTEPEARGNYALFGASVYFCGISLWRTFMKHEDEDAPDAEDEPGKAA